MLANYDIPADLVEAVRQRRFTDAGYALMANVCEAVDDEGNDEAIEDLGQILELHDENRGTLLWFWLRRELPRCMELIPAAEMESFLLGVEMAIERSADASE
jgi:hypothetical protein